MGQVVILEMIFHILKSVTELKAPHKQYHKKIIRHDSKKRDHLTTVAISSICHSGYHVSGWLQPNSGALQFIVTPLNRMKFSTTS